MITSADTEACSPLILTYRPPSTLSTTQQQPRNTDMMRSKGVAQPGEMTQLCILEVALTEHKSHRKGKSKGLSTTD